MSLAALGAIAGGLNQGIDLAQRDRELQDQRALREEERSFRTEDRAFKKLQQDDFLTKQKRENEKAARDQQYGQDYAAANAPVTETKDAANFVMDNGGTGALPPTAPQTVTRPRTELERLAAVNAAQVKGQRFTEADQTQQAMRKIFTDVDRQNYNTLLQSANAMDLDQLATSAQKLVTADGSPLVADAPARNDDGSYTFNIRNKWNGTAMPFTAKTKEDVLRGLQYHMDYETYAANAKAAQAKRDKIDETLATQRPVAIGANGLAVPDGKGGWSQAPGVAGAGVAGAGGAANTRAGAGKATDPNKPIADALEFLKPALKDETPEMVAKLQQYTYQVVTNSGVPAQLAATIAVDAARNPAKLQPRLDPRTGSIDVVYDTPETGEIKFTRGYATPAQPNGLKPEQFKTFTNQLLAAQPPAVKDKLVTAAFEDKGEARRDLETAIKAEISAGYAQRLKANPGAKAQIEAERDATIQSTMASLGRKLALVRGYYPKPQDKAPEPRIKQPAGLPGANKYDGMKTPQMNKAAAEEGRNFRAANPRPQADPQARAQLAALEQQRSALIRQGKAVDANAVTEKIRALKSQSGL